MRRYPIQTPVWTPAIAPLSLSPDTLHIWRATLAQPEPVLAHFTATLSPDERERAFRLRVPHHQQRAIASRGILRCILATYLDCPPEHLRFAYGDRGKPELQHSNTAPPLHFNVTHSENLALFAIAPFPDVGIDLEICQPLPYLSQLMQRYCSPQEQAAIAAHPPEQHEECFFYHWTTKEALTKATGRGMTDLEKVQLQWTAAGVEGIYEPSPIASSWQVHLIAPQTGYIGAIAYPASEARSLQFLDWQFLA